MKHLKIWENFNNTLNENTSEEITDVTFDHVDEDLNILAIDGTLSRPSNDGSDMIVIAYLCLDTGKVIFVKNEFRRNDMVRSAIKDAIKEFGMENKSSNYYW